MASLGTYSQKTWPGVGDIDDCWVISTFWALVAAGIIDEWHIPTVYAFRAAAGRPDVQGKASGGSNADIIKALNKLLPQAGARMYNSGISGFKQMLSSGYIASLSVNSSMLPAYLQFGFKGLHQIAVIYQDGQFYVMNPLANQGAPLLLISQAALAKAAGGFAGTGKMSAVLIKVGGVVLKQIIKDGKRMMLPQPPRDLNAPIVVRNYLDPLTVGDFYRARHKEDNVLE
jgi:hypothetical protein